MSPALPAVHEEFCAPPAGLRAVVQHLLVLTAKGPGPVVRTILPNFQALLLVNLGPPAAVWFADDPPQRLTTMLVTGPLTTAMQYQLPPQARVLVVTLTLSGFYQLFRVPAEHLRGGFIDPDTLGLAGSFAQLWERLQGVDSLAHLGQLVADFCQAHVQPPHAAQAELLGQLPLLKHAGPLGALKAMAAASRLSERTLQTHFRKYLGFSAKEATRFLRFRRLLAEVQRAPASQSAPDWLALLEQHGYYDQSHLIHDFTHYLRQPPNKVVAQLRTDEAICFTNSILLT
jgi:AraC-like DNA-binding protein